MARRIGRRIPTAAAMRPHKLASMGRSSWTIALAPLARAPLVRFPRAEFRLAQAPPVDPFAACDAARVGVRVGAGAGSALRERHHPPWAQEPPAQGSRARSPGRRPRILSARRSRGPPRS